MTDFKVAVIGNSSVGKTSIISTLQKGVFEDRITPTVGATYISKIFETEYGTADLHIWDTAGQEKFRSVVPMYLRNSDAAIITCAVDSIESVQQLSSWIEMLENIVVDSYIVIVCNKIDIGKNDVYEKARDFANANKYPFYATTSKDFTTIEPLFRDIANEVMRYAAEINKKEEEAQLELTQTTEEHKKGCC